MKNIEKQFKYLKVLSKQYPSISKASTEIINLEAILNLPKGTEHFISDILLCFLARKIETLLNIIFQSICLQ